MNLQPIYDLAEICHQAGIKDAVLSPGSRCAPLVLAFARHPGMRVKTISDERAAAFIALGMAQATNQPVVLICTSGSAAYNYAPAVSEAFFRNVPLVIITADRPPEWIGQQDGQTIWQEQLYGKHVHYSGSALTDLNHPDAKWFLRRTMNEALNTAISRSGPVHINVPFREPFYPSDDEVYYETDRQFVQHHKPSVVSIPNQEELEMKWRGHAKKLIVMGQHDPDAHLSKALKSVADHLHIPVVGDVIANIHKNGGIQNADVFLPNVEPDNLKPDLLISFGGAMLSKNLKKFFRTHQPENHWHIQPDGNIADTFKTLTDVVRLEPAAFLDHFGKIDAENDFDRQKQENYYRIWEIEAEKVRSNLSDFFGTGQNFGEFEMVYQVLQKLPSGCNLHLANSMAVRYANFCGIDSEKENITVFSNRGTCGIDGCTSTAVGTALADPDKLNILITGDMAFFYDRNAFWHNYPLGNLRIVLLNNHGGGIFRMINGPASLPELEPYFETRQPLTARAICQEFGFDHLSCDKRSKMNNFIGELMTDDQRVKILELESDSASNTEILARFKNSF